MEAMQEDLFFERFDTVIQSPKHMVLACHVNPDGDAVGSVLALGEFLKAKGHEVKMVVANDFPGFLHWMPGAEDFLVFEKDSEACKTAIAEAECIVMLDFNNLSRGGILHNEIGKTRCPRVLVDHHRDADLSQFYCSYTRDLAALWEGPIDGKHLYQLVGGHYDGHGLVCPFHLPPQNFRYCQSIGGKIHALYACTSVGLRYYVGKPFAFVGICHQ